MPRPGQELASIDFESMLGGPLVAVVNAQAQAAMSTVNFIKSVGFESPGEDQEFENQGVGKPIYVAFKYPKEVAPFDPGSPGEVTGIQVAKGGSGYTSAPTVTITGGGGSGAQATATIDTASGSVTGVSVTSPGEGYTTTPSISIDAPQGDGGETAEATATIDALREQQPAKFQEMKLEVPILTILPIPFIRIDSTSIDFNAKINSVEFRNVDTALKVDASGSKRFGLGFLGSVNFKVNTSFQRNTQQGTKVERTYSMAVNIRAVQDEMPAGMERILGILEDAIQAQPAKLPAAEEV